jgi:hypothetical protein
VRAAFSSCAACPSSRCIAGKDAAIASSSSRAVFNAPSLFGVMLDVPRRVALESPPDHETPRR